MASEKKEGMSLHLHSRAEVLASMTTAITWGRRQLRMLGWSLLSNAWIHKTSKKSPYLAHRRPITGSVVSE